MRIRGGADDVGDVTSSKAGTLHDHGARSLARRCDCCHSSGAPGAHDEYVRLGYDTEISRELHIQLPYCEALYSPCLRCAIQSVLYLQKAQPLLVGVGRVTFSADRIEEGSKEGVLTFGFYCVAEIRFPALDDVLVRGVTQIPRNTLEIGTKVEGEVPAV